MGSSTAQALLFERTATLTPWLLLCVALAFLAIRLSARLGMWPYAVLALPGTVAHELAHYLVAVLLRARPSFPSLLPQRSERGWRLGSVAFHAGKWRAVPIALAPLLLFPLAFWWASGWLAGAQGLLLALHAWVVAALLSASLPSRTDLRIAMPGLLLIAAMAVLVALVIWRY